MSFVILKNGNLFYQKRVSTTRDGQHFSKPKYVEDVKDANVFSSDKVVKRSLQLLKEVEPNTTFEIKSVTVTDTSVLLEEDIKPKAQTTTSQATKLQETRVPITSILSMTAKSKFTLADHNGVSHDMQSAHQGFAFMKAVYAEDDDAVNAIVATNDTAKISYLSRQVNIGDVEAYDKIRPQLMNTVLSARYAEDSDFASALDLTGSSKIVILSQNNYWGDNYGNGSNMLGKCLETVRDRVNDDA